MKLNRILPLALILLSILSCKPKQDYPAAEDGKLTWISIDQAATIANSDKKMYLIDVYTNWCGWCKKMDKTTFVDPAVMKHLADKYHVVKFNAEQTAPVQWEGETYEYKQGGRKGVNMFASKILNKRLSYPSFAVMDENRKPIKVIVGFKNAEQFLDSLKEVEG